MCVLSSLFNCFHPRHLPENSIPFDVLWNKIRRDELGSWRVDMVACVLAV